MRGVRTDEWSYMHYPNGEGQPDTEKAELYNLKTDPLETEQPDRRARRAGRRWPRSRRSCCKIQQDTGGLPDKMPINPQLRFEMPDAAIR